MSLQLNNVYTVVKKIKIHTSPLVQVIVPQTGRFIKETDSYLIFRGFRVKKSVVVDIKEEEK